MRIFKKKKEKIPLTEIMSENIRYVKELAKYKLKLGDNKVYTRVHDGIVFEANTMELIEEMVKFYEQAKLDGNPETTKEFFDGLKKVGTKISCVNIKRHEIRDGYHFLGYAPDLNFQDKNMIHLTVNDVVNRNSELLFHEGGHVLDYYSRNYYNSYLGVKWATENFAKDALNNKNNLSDDFINYFSSFQRKYIAFIEKLDNDLEGPKHKKNIDEITMKKCKQIYGEAVSKTNFELMRERIKYCYRDSIIRNSGMGPISDIYCALTNGRLTEDPSVEGNEKGNSSFEVKSTIYYGHFNRYFAFPPVYYNKLLKKEEITDEEVKDSLYRKVAEILADFSALINLGKKDLMYEFFPSDFIEKLQETYDQIIMQTREKNMAVAV